MSDNKKYYYLKLKDNFFDSDATIVLESMPDGYLYSNILLKLYLRSLKNDGKLMFNDRIPYNPTILAQVTRHNVGVVEKALNIFRELDLIEIMDNGAIYMLDIQNFIGESSTEADRIRKYRNKIKAEKEGFELPDVTNVRTNVTNKSVQMYDKSTPEIEIELEIDKELELEIETKEEEEEVGIRLSKGFKDEVLKTWNDINSMDNNFSKIRTISDKRAKKLRSLAKKYSEDEILKAIDLIKRSSFLRGKNERGWSADIDWFLIENNFLKILEEKYTDKKSNKVMALERQEEKEKKKEANADYQRMKDILRKRKGLI